MIAVMAPGRSLAAAAVASPRSRTSADRIPVRQRSAGRQGRVLADGMPDDDVGTNAGRLDRTQAGDRCRHERRLLHLRLGQLLDRPLEAEPLEVEPGRLERFAVDRARLGRRLREVAAHADLVGALAGEAERDLHAPPPSCVQRSSAEPHVSPAPAAVMRTVSPG